MRDNITSWILSILTPVATAISLLTKIFVNPMRTVIYGGTLIIIVGVTAIWGHILDKPILYQWFGEMPGMAIETGSLFVLLGAEVITLAVAIIKIKHSVEDVDTRPRRKRP